MADTQHKSRVTAAQDEFLKELAFENPEPAAEPWKLRENMEMLSLITGAMTASKAWPVVFNAGSAQELAQAVLVALDKAGLTVAPKEPTGDMIAAGLRELQENLGSTSVIDRDPLFTYRAMLHARPK